MGAGFPMRSDLTPARWLDYEPPGLCHIAALSAIGAVASVAGTGLSILSSSQQSSYQSGVARNEALIAKQKANEDAAIGQRAAITESRKTDLALSRARAVGAASGTDATSPSQVNIEGGIAQQGGYNALSALYEGMAKSRADTDQAAIDLYKADRIAAAQPLTTTGLLFSGASKLATNLSLGSRKSPLLDMYGDY